MKTTIKRYDTGKMYTDNLQIANVAEHREDMNTLLRSATHFSVWRTGEIFSSSRDEVEAIVDSGAKVEVSMLYTVYLGDGDVPTKSLYVSEPRA